MGNRNSKPAQKFPMENKDIRRNFSTHCGASIPKEEPSKFSADLFMKIGTRLATITAVYERVSQPLPALPPVPSPTTPNAVDNDGYEVPNPFHKSIFQK